MVVDDELYVKIADLGNACWTVSYRLSCNLVTML